MVAPPPAALEGYARSQLVRDCGAPELYRPTQGRYERRWAGLDMAMQRIWALHSRAYIYVFHMREGTDDRLRAHAHSCVVISVSSIGGKACGVTDGTRARPLDVLLHDRGAHL